MNHGSRWSVKGGRQGRINVEKDVDCWILLSVWGAYDLPLSFRRPRQ